MSVTPASEIRELEVLRSSRGWALIVAELQAYNERTMLRLATAANMDQAALHKALGSFAATANLMTSPDRLIQHFRLELAKQKPIPSEEPTDAAAS